MVYCPNFERCGGASEKRVDASNQDAQPFYCDKCFRADKSRRMGGAWKAFKSGQQKNGKAEKGKAGRKPILADADVFSAIAALGSRASTSQVAKKLGCARSTLIEWARGKGFGSFVELLRDHRSKRGGVGN
jgi:hypothetical protein